MLTEKGILGMPRTRFSDPTRARAPGDDPVRERLVPATVVLTALVLAWTVAYVSGGSHTVVPHLFYIPVVVAGLRLGVAGSALTAVLAALLAGPALPLYVATGESQALWSWLLRGVMFVTIGLVTAWLTRPGEASLGAAVRDARISFQLRHALRRGHVDVHYQPIVDLENGVVVGLEALARWTHPTMGRVPPATFIPVAERTGVINELDCYVLRTAVTEVSSWLKADPMLTLSVNVSAARFADPRLIDHVEAALAESGLDPHRLQLEITETAVIADIEAASAQISLLRERGVRVAVDDFGAGHTSLGYLSDFTIDTLKMDRTFVTRATAHPQTSRLLAGLVALFGSMGMQVVGEGISTPEEYLEMLASGCPLGQGFFLGRPASLADIRLLLAGQGHSRLPDIHLSDRDDGDVRGRSS